MIGTAFIPCTVLTAWELSVTCRENGVYKDQGRRERAAGEDVWLQMEEAAER